jgi:structural maintenance of chromosome 1
VRDQKFASTLETLRSLFPGVHGRVDELCRPSHRKYDVAATIVLGSKYVFRPRRGARARPPGPDHALVGYHSMDAVVVDTEKVARDCIQYMRTGLLCVATFLPLDTIRTKPVPDRLRTLHAGARPAIDTLTYVAMAYLCGAKGSS